MVNQWFSISDERFLTFLSGLNNSLAKSEVPYMFAGGIAHQVHMARYLCSIHGATLEELAKSGEIHLPNHIKATDNVDIALGLIADKNYSAAVKALEEKNEEAARKYKNAIKMLKPNQRIEAEKREAMRKEEIKNEINKLKLDRDYQTDKRIRETLDEYKVKALDSLTQKEIITIKQTREGHSRRVYTLGVFEEQNDEQPLTIKLYHKIEDVAKNGHLKELSEELYPKFLFEAQNIVIHYAPGLDISLKVMRPEDLVTTKISLWSKPTNGSPDAPNRHVNDALDILNYSKKSGNPVNYEIIEENLCKKRTIVSRANSKEEEITLDNPILREHYALLRQLADTL